jgi:TonB family protein
MDMKASFQGGKQAMIDFLSTHLKYPERALKNKKQGTVEVKFVVDINGNVSSLMIPKGIDKELDVEAMRLVRSMPKWLPELKDGSLVPSYQSLKIEFDI